MLVFLFFVDNFQHVGDTENAVKCLDEAQSLDTADRYINCKCAKYMLRANQVQEQVIEFIEVSNCAISY